MSQQTSPFIEGKYGWNFGESGWNTGMDENLVKFSYLFDRNIDGIVSTPPLPPVNGKAFFNTTDNRLYFVTGGVYYSSPVPKWFEIVERTTGNIYQFNGTTLNQISTASSLDTRLDAVELTVDSLGTAAFEDTSYFVTPDQLSERGLIPNAVGDGIADDTAALVAWATNTTYKRKYLPFGVYKCSQRLIFNPGDYVYGDGDASVLDFSGGIGGATACVSVTGSVVALPNLASNVSLRDNTLTFTSAPSVEFGDVILIWNPTNSSWSTWRADYRAGEWCRVAIVNGTSVSIYSRLYDSYNAADVQIYKLVGASTTFKEFRIKQPFTSNVGLSVEFIDTPVIHNITTGNAVYAGISVQKCFDPDIDCNARQASAPSGNNYGLAVGNSQGGSIRGVYYGTRHPISLGGATGVGSVTNRDMDVYASYCGLSAGINAVDLHGNTENIRFHGVSSMGGFVIAGKNNSWYGGNPEGGANGGIAVYMGEVVSGTFNLVGLNIASYENPNVTANGILSFQNFTASVSGDCHFIFTGCSIKCPSATTFPILFALNGTSAKINISFKGGLTFTDAVGLTQVLRLRQFGTTGSFGIVSMPEVSGIPANCPYVIEVGSPVVDKYELPAQMGIAAPTITTAVSTVSTSVTYPHAYPRAPRVITSNSNPVAGGKRSVTGYTGRTATGFSAVIATCDNTNFTAAETGAISWYAELSEV